MVGRNILHYNIMEEIGSGGIGVVYKAYDTHLARIVALKCLPGYTAVNKEDRIRFMQEAKMAASLNHPAIATIHGFEEADRQMFIVMEYIEGQNLRKYITKEQGEGDHGLTIEKIFHIVLQIAEALHAAHEKGIVHRDIKPENIMITPSGQVKMLDFGLARMSGTELLTRPGTVMGTVAYMSPEQISGGTADCRSDIWSWGVMFYELLSGVRPFNGEYEQALIYAILNEQPRDLHSRYGPLPVKIKNIIDMALAKDPDRRFSNCRQLLQELKPALGQDVGESQITYSLLRKAGDNISGYIKRVQSKPVLYYSHIITLAALLSAILFFILQPAAADFSGPGKIAVLPFVNINNTTDDDYFSDGIMEDILTQLVKISNLKVISRTTMMTYKNSPKTLREISQELGADIVLEGSVRREEGQVRITVQLIDAGSDEHLWAETYDREIKQVFSVQSEIALNIAAKLHARLSEDEQDRLHVAGVLDPEVYNLLLKGGHYLARGSRSDVNMAIDQLRQALQLDTLNARAWAQLATAYARLADLGAVSSAEGYENARQAAQKALALDDQLAQAHTIMGWIKRSYDWDWQGAEVECRKALQIAPGDVNVIRNMANMEKSLGRFEEAIELMKKATELDPARVPVYTSLGLLSMYAGHLDQAAAAYLKAIDINPDYPVAHTFLGLVYLLQDNTQKAITEILKEPDEGWQLYGLSQAFFHTGDVNEAANALTQLIEKYGDDSAYQVAQVYAWRGEADAAFAWLEKAYASRDGGLSELKGDPFMKKIEKDPRYSLFMKKMRLPL